MIFSGVLAGLFFCFLVGGVVGGRGNVSLSEFLISTMAKSLFVSWFVVYFSYWVALPDLVFPLMALCVGLWLFQAKKGLWSVTVPFSPMPLALLAIIVAIFVYLFQGGAGSDYRLIFMTWDAVASWNRWAIELSANEYKPMAGSSYPLLLPALWSLVYKAQGSSELWMVAKGLLFVFPALLFLIFFLLLSVRFYMVATFFLVFAGVFFFSRNAFAMLQGNVDIPLAVMLLAGGTSLLYSLHWLERGRVEELKRGLLMSVFFVGLAAITKQQGGVMFAPLALTIMIAWRRKLLTFGTGAVLLFVAVLPLFSFLTIFFSLDGNPFGNLGGLSAISAASSSGEPFRAALEFVLAMVPTYLWFVLLGLSLLNLFFFRSPAGVLGILFLLLGVAAFFFYGKCCSYEARNGWWVLMMFVLSALFGLAQVESRLFWRKVGMGSRSGMQVNAFFLLISMLALAAGGAALVSAAYPDDRARREQVEMQWSLTGYSMGGVLRENIGLLGSDGVIVSEVNLFEWLPGMRGRLRLCQGRDVACIEKGRSGRRHVLVVVQRGVLEYPSLADLLVPAALVADADGYQLYDISELSAEKPSMLLWAREGVPLRLDFDAVGCTAVGFPPEWCKGSGALQYFPADNSWVFRQLGGPDGAAGAIYRNAPDRAGAVSVAGAVGVLDRGGNVFIGLTRIGRVSVAGG